MKKIIYVIGTVLVIVVCTCYVIIKHRYDKNRSTITDRFWTGSIAYVIENWKEEKGIFPTSLQEVYDTVKTMLFGMEVACFETDFLEDVLSRKQRWVMYVPLYSEESDSIESYILVSAGIDGKLDNVLPDSVKLHRSDWKQKLKLYNTNEFQDLSVNRPLLHESVFNLRDYWFGKKDLLIFEREQVIL